MGRLRKTSHGEGSGRGTKNPPDLSVGSVKHTALVKALRKQMGWSLTKGTYRISGIKIPQKSGADVLLFDLNSAVCGKRVAQKVDPETFLQNCPAATNLRSSPLFVPAVVALPEIINHGSHQENIVDADVIEVSSKK